MSNQDDCSPAEPDSVQISWNTPCDSGDWLFEPGVGCRMWDWHPMPEDRVTWAGHCKDGAKSGHGIVQWFEHGRLIDRFEGTFDRGRRRGFGRYSWTPNDKFEGYYDADLPDGRGTITIDNVPYVGTWHHGCHAHHDKVIAVGVPLSTCTRVPAANGVEQARKR